MDEINETPVVAIVETEPEQDSFAKDLAKAAALNAAGIVGTFGGLALVGFAAGKIRDARDRRRSAKETSTETETETSSQE